jgi:SDR family mycofactocin-dependent oxidoreductase
MQGRLAGKVAFITGIARGQGRSHALRLAEEGADIIGIDLCAQLDSVGYPMSTPADLTETVTQIEALDRRIVAAQADVRNPESMRAVLDRGIEALGRLDFVIANAGVMPIWGPGAQTTQAWHDCLDVLLTGVLNTVELTYPLLRDQGEGGSIIITSSMAALAPMMWTEQSHTLGLLGYSAAKSALVNLAQNYASFLAPHGIRVTSIHPTGVDTPMINNEVSRTRFEHANEQDLRALVNAIPVTRVEPADVSNAVLWLCSNDSRYFTGSVLRIDAGASLR